MTTFRLTEIQQLAIQAKLNFALGAFVYDDVFTGFEVLEIVGDELRGWATSEYRAAVIDIQFSRELAAIAQTVTGRPVQRTSFVLRGLKHVTDEQPAWEADDGALAAAFFAATSKRRAVIARHKGVRSSRKKLLRSRS